MKGLYVLVFICGWIIGMLAMALPAVNNCQKRNFDDWDIRGCYNNFLPEPEEDRIYEHNL